MAQFQGENINEAIEKGLRALGKKQSEVDVNVIHPGKKGFLGIGKQQAVVELIVRTSEEDLQQEATSRIENANETKFETETEKPVDDGQAEVSVDAAAEQETANDGLNTALNDALVAAQAYLQTIIEALEMTVTIEQVRKKQAVHFQINGGKQGLLIGKHGRNLNALQYLVQTYVHRLVDTRLAIIVNVGDYREKRQEALQHLAKQTAAKVKRTGETVFLEPMPAFERKQVHAALSKDPYVKTHSEGAEPHRYLVVEVVKNVL